MDKETKFKIAENMKVLASTAEEVRVSAAKKIDEKEALYLLVEYGKKEAEVKLVARSG